MVVAREKQGWEYGIDQHRHRFAVWAAARATQRGFAKVDVLRDALECSGVVEFLQSAACDETDAEAFLVQHRVWCRSIIEHLKSSHPAVTFGRAAKLIAVYLKAAVVIVRPETMLAQVAHPPIDAILLRNLCRATRSPLKNQWAAIRWTQLSEQSYYALIGQLRSALPQAQPFGLLSNIGP